MYLYDVVNSDLKSNFYEKLPKKPYCSWGKATRTLIYPKKSAINFPLIQINAPHQINYLIFDIDAPDAYLHFSDADLPSPNWISKNRTNGHCHICYALKTPIYKTESARIKPLRYLASIEYSYAKKLGADLRYSGLLTKNPLNDEWQTTFIHSLEYELAELADYVDLESKPKADLKDVSGLGRNCMMFDIVRFWSYKAIREHLSDGYSNWYANVLEQAINANGEFLEPLPYGEIKSTAKSIARWVWRNHAEAHAKFIERQTLKGRKGGLNSNSSNGGKARSAQYCDIRHEALKLHLMGVKVTQIAKQLGISRPSVYAYLKSVKVQA